MTSFRRYFRSPMIDKDGTFLPFSRIDIGASVILALCLMVDISLLAAMTTDGWERAGVLKMIATFVIGGLTLLLGSRRLVLGCALGIVSFRLIFGSIFISHSGPMILGTLVCCLATYLLLKDLQ